MSVTFEITAPDGTKYHVEGPDGSTEEQALTQIRAQHDTAGPSSFDAVNGQLVPTGSPAAVAAQQPTSGMSTPALLAAGAGKGLTDLARGAGQVVGLESRQDVADARKRDAALMATGAGKTGDVIGTVAGAVPAAFIPGANTMLGAAGVGAGLGLLQPSTSTGETLGNIGLGAVASPAGLALGRGLGAVASGGKALIEPFFAGGQDKIAARALQTFAGGDAAAAKAAANLANPPSVLPGVQPTTAELADNAGLAQFERTLRNNPTAMNALTDRNQANRAAMTGALDSIAGTPQAMTAAEQARAQAAAPLYAAAKRASAPIDNTMTALLQRPSMQSALQRGQKLAEENGSGFGLASYTPGMPMQLTGSDLQYLKMGIDDIANTAEQKGIGAHEQLAINSSRAALNNWIKTNVPSLKAADAVYAGASVPINQMQVGQALSNKLQPALADFGNNTRLNANSFANAVRNGDSLASNVTGQENATLTGVLSPSQMTTVKQIGEQLARRANADELGRAVGSNTGQNLVSQNLVSQFLGPFGLPQSMTQRVAQSTLLQSIMRPAQWIAGAAEPRVMDKLVGAALDPKVAQQFLSKGISPTLAMRVWARQGLLGPIGQGLAQSSQQ